MAQQFTFRVDESELVTRDSVWAFVNNLGVRHFVARELSEETKKWHYQGWVRTDMSNQNLRNKIIAAWPSVKSVQKGRSNGKYSCAPVRKETYEVYVCKGSSPTDLPDVVSMSMGECDVEANHRIYWSSQASTAPRKVHLVVEGIEHFASYDWGDSSLRNKRLEICQWLIDKQRGKGIDSFRLKAWVNGILAQIDPSAKEYLCVQVADSERW